MQGCCLVFIIAIVKAVPYCDNKSSNIFYISFIPQFAEFFFCSSVQFVKTKNIDINFSVQKIK